MCSFVTPALVIVFLLCGTVQVESSSSEPDCTGTDCNILRAIIMKLVITFFDFDCMYTDYLSDVSECLCGPLDECIGTHYNKCIQQEVIDDIACKNCSFVDMHIVNTKESDFNCFPQSALLEYRNCICEKPLEQCPGAVHNECFREVFSII